MTGVTETTSSTEENPQSSSDEEAKSALKSPKNKDPEPYFSVSGGHSRIHATSSASFVWVG